MRVLTVRQPWAWAIIHGGKDVENRVRNIAGAYRGPIAIHVAGKYAEYVDSTALDDATELWHDQPDADCNHHPWKADAGRIIGVIDLVGVHDSRRDGCGTRRGTARLGELIPQCSEWAEPWAHHLVLANPRPLSEPIPFKGALGLRRLDEAMVRRIEAAIA